MKSNTNQNLKNNILSIFIETGLILSFFCTLLYTAGWSYAYNYFKHFNIGLLGVSIPKEYFFMYGFISIKKNALLFLFYLLLFFYIPIGRKILSIIQNKLIIFNNFKTNSYFFYSILILLCLFVMLEYFCFYKLGKITAERDYKTQQNDSFSSYPGIKIKLKPQTKDVYLKLLSDDLMSGCYRLLFRNQGILYLFYYTQNESEIMATQIISESHIVWEQIFPNYKICN